MEKWGFLEPWRVVLRDSITTEIAGALSLLTRIEATLANKKVDPVLQVSISFAKNYSTSKTICLKLPVDEASRRDASRLCKLREAMELFTLLSMVDNRVFTALMASETNKPSQTGNHRVQLPRWTLQLVGALSPDGIAAVHSQVTWGALLGFPDDPREYSAEFRDAITKLEAMGTEEESIKKSVSNGLSIRWESSLPAINVSGDHTAVAPDDPSNPLRGRFRKLFDAIAPPVAQICATRGIWEWGHQTVPEFTAALARTPMSWLVLSFESGAMSWWQHAMNVGCTLNSLICGHPLCSATERSRPDPIRLEFDRLDLSCGTISDCNAAICSAIAELAAEANLYTLALDLRGDGSWSWLVFALCCGNSDVSVLCVDLSNCKLTKSDILAVSAVLQTNYPQPLLESDGKGSLQYGFADIREGAELHLCGLSPYEETNFVVSRACRCRAHYDPADSEWVNVVVPGYGICKAKLGGKIRFTPDSERPGVRRKRVCGSLTMHDAQFETAAVLVDLLTPIARGLRKLTLCAACYGVPIARAIQIDLSALASACPELQHLSISGFTAVVSAHSESLRRWPIRTIFLCWSGLRTTTLPDLTECFRNPTLRMARELVKLEVKPSYADLFFADGKEVRELEVHDSEFLPLTKQKLPVKSKAAMVSVVKGASSAIRLLDTDTLKLIFVFASTPAQRDVKCWTAEDYESQ